MNNKEPGLYDFNGRLIATWNSFIRDFQNKTPLPTGARLVIPENEVCVNGGLYFFRTCRTRPQSIDVPSGVTEITADAFIFLDELFSINVDTKNPAYCSFDGILFTKDKKMLVCYPRAKTEDLYVIPDDVTRIGALAFNFCTNLTGITIPGNVTGIDDCAFQGCKGLTGIVIPDNVTSISTYTFAGCTNLRTITLPDGLTHIGTGAFSGCASLTDVTIPDTVTGIGDYVFGSCTNLTGINIPKNVTTIGQEAFYNCKSLTDITFGGTVAQWNAIAMGADWNEDVPATQVVCSDGTVKLL